MPRPAFRSLCLAFVALLAMAPAALAAAPAPTESYAMLLTQIDAKSGSGNRVTAATLDKADHHVRVTLARRREAAGFLPRVRRQVPR